MRRINPAQTTGGDGRMARKAQSTHTQEIHDLRDRVDWLDGERRRLTRKLGELEQSLALQAREIEGREQRIRELEGQFSTVSAQITRLSQTDTRLSQFKDEVVQMIEQYDQRRIRAENEIDRLRRVEHEVTVREIADVRKELPAIGRLRDNMEMRVAEETRLAKLIGEQKSRIDSLEDVTESREQTLSFLNEKEKQNSRNIAEARTSLLESNKRYEHLREQVETGNANVLRLDSTQQSAVEEQDKLRESLKMWIEQIRMGEYERNQKLEAWERGLADHEEVMTKYSQDWILFSDQFKEAKMAVQTLSEWQKQLELQQREATQLLKVETNRLQSLWDEYRQDNENRWRTYSIESDQRWATVNRQEKLIEEKIVALEESLTKLDQQYELFRRIQSAQTDAIKRLPLMWMEEVEKAIAQDPHRRRQPALVPINEE
jgi:chromosome segregation ATPase